MNPALLSVQGFAERSGRTFDPTDVRVIRALQDASALIRSYTAQTLHFVPDDVVELRGTYSDVLFLPERPVIDITAVAMRGWQTSIFTDYLEGSWFRRGSQLTMHGGWGGPRAAVIVTYSHGYAEIPEDLAAVCASIAARGVRDLAGDMVSETIVDYSYQLAGAGQTTGMALGLTGMEKVALDRYRLVGAEAA